MNEQGRVSLESGKTESRPLRFLRLEKAKFESLHTQYQENIDTRRQLREIISDPKTSLFRKIKLGIQLNSTEEGISFEEKISQINSAINDLETSPIKVEKAAAYLVDSIRRDLGAIGLQYSLLAAFVDDSQLPRDVENDITRHALEGWICLKQLDNQKAQDFKVNFEGLATKFRHESIDDLLNYYWQNPLF